MIDIPAATRGVTLAPNWDAYFSEFDDGTAHAQLNTPGIAPDPYRPDEPETMFPGGLSYELPRHPTSEDLATSIVAAMAVNGFHEALEWVRLHGRRLATPHPDGEDAMWDWLMERMTGLVREYIDRYPTEDT